MINWEQAAEYCFDVYGIHVDWEERFFHCPECDEPLYESDWDDHDFEDGCPVCCADIMSDIDD